ncbi:MAG: response regulator [Planctomycetales bacterium]|nr:response regulator [Planctomycetales bacterium]
MTQKVLLVDDDPNVLDGFKRHLRKKFDFSLAVGPEAALEELRQHGPFAVVVSDMQMPGMTGVQLLHRIGELSPDTVRMMLTGNADQQTAVEAVNEGHIFRFLNKPCEPEVLAQALIAGIEQYRLVRAEKDLLSKTLAGSVALMTEVLSMTMPQTFARAMKLKRLAQQLCRELRVTGAWDIEIAAMLSQLGCVSLPEELLEKLYQGEKLSDEESRLYQTVPKVGADLVRRIPRLEGVAKMIAHQQDRHEQLTQLEPSELNSHQVLGAAILKVTLDADLLGIRLSHSEIVRLISQSQTGRYHPDVARAFANLVGEQVEVRSIHLNELRIGMVLEEHLESTAGGILVPKGQEVTETLLKRLKNFADPDRFIRQPFQVQVSVAPHDVPVAQAPVA